LVIIDDPLVEDVNGPARERPRQSVRSRLWAGPHRRLGVRPSAVPRTRAGFASVVLL